MYTHRIEQPPSNSCMTYLTVLYAGRKLIVAYKDIKKCKMMYNCGDGMPKSTSHKKFSFMKTSPCTVGPVLIARI